jgi:AraC family transcriptional regulator, regulatory protein of adaptative response / methylated-DNA-[protein]-cysteine methyltransferase
MIKNVNIVTLKELAQDQNIFYSIHLSRYSLFVIANTVNGICSLMFITKEQQALTMLKNRFKKGTFIKKETLLQKPLIDLLKSLPTFNKGSDSIEPIKLNLVGTDFQLKVWQALLDIPYGQTTTYGNIAATIGNPQATRAVGTAIGQNPIAYLIPCHRVLRSDGSLGGYKWGLRLKKEILLQECREVEKG